MDGTQLARIIFVGMAVVGLVALLWVRRKPADWRPPRWDRESLFGPVTRDSYMLFAGAALGAGVALLYASFSWLP